MSKPTRVSQTAPRRKWPVYSGHGPITKREPFQAATEGDARAEEERRQREELAGFPQTAVEIITALREQVKKLEESTRWVSFDLNVPMADLSDLAPPTRLWPAPYPAQGIRWTLYNEDVAVTGTSSATCVQSGDEVIQVGVESSPEKPLTFGDLKVGQRFRWDACDDQTPRVRTADGWELCGMAVQAGAGDALATVVPVDRDG